MQRRASIVVLISIAVIAACAAIALAAKGLLEPTVAAFAGCCLFALGAFLQEVLLWRRQRLRMEDDAERSRAAILALIGRVERLETTVKAVLTRTGGAVPSDRAQAADPNTMEIATLGALVKDLADALAEHEKRFGDLADQSAAGMRGEEPHAPMRLTDPAPIFGQADVLASEHVEVYLQPIVTLPQRKVRYYEAQPRLRGEDGLPRVLHPVDDAHLAASVEAVLFQRATQVVRRLSAKNRDISILCVMSAPSIGGTEFAAMALTAAAATPGLAAQMILELDQAALRRLGGVELERLRALAGAGYRFSVGRITDLRLDAQPLGDRGFRLARVAAATLLDPAKLADVEIHPADLAGLLARYGIELVANEVSSEAVAVELLDFDVKLAQGDLFSPARPVRADVLQDDVRLLPPTRAALPPSPAPSAPQGPAAAAASPPRREARAPTLGETALQDTIRSLVATRIDNAEPAASADAAKTGAPAERRSAWHTLARRTGRRA